MLCILITLFYREFQISDAYSLFPPFSFTQLLEIKDWSIRGSVANLKSFLRLTSATANNFGGICHRIPTRFQDWTIELEFLTKGGNGGEGFYFYFTKEFCPDNSDLFNGFAIFINTTTIYSSNYSQLSFHNTFNHSNSSLVGKIHIKNSSSTRLYITKTNNSIEMEYLSNGFRTKIFTANLNMPIRFGYFSLYSYTNSKHFSNHDLHSFRTYPMSEVFPESKINYSSLNRKVLQDNQIVRKVLKENKRARMPISRIYRQLRHELNDSLSGEPQNLKDAFKIIREAETRMTNTVTITNLSNFINIKVDPSIEKVIKMIEIAQLKFDDCKIDMNDAWSYLKTQIIDLSVESEQAMQKLKDEMISYAKTIKLAKINHKQMKRGIQLGNNHLKIESYLMLICLLEFVIYVIVFIIKRHKTQGFKKID